MSKRLHRSYGPIKSAAYRTQQSCRRYGRCGHCIKRGKLGCGDRIGSGKGCNVHEVLTVGARQGADEGREAV